MSHFLTLLLTVLFTLRTVRNALFLTYLWQLKEYRLDRMLVHLKETQQGRELLIGRQTLVKWILILIFPLTFTHRIFSLAYPFLVLVVYLFEVRASVAETLLRRLKRPTFTLKATFIVFVAILLETILVMVPLFDMPFWVLLLDKGLPILIFFLVLALSLPTELLRDRKILKATKALRLRKKLIIIGVSGSYGKTSTKEFIAYILSEKFNVLKTAGTNNTPIGIANAILRGLRKDTQVFVVEMGAYKKGEVRQMCEIVRPTIGVLTGISPQHLSLFGSLEHITQAKYELIEALPKDGLAIFNGNNEYARQLYEKTETKKLLYSFGRESDIHVSHIRVRQRTVSCTVKIGRSVASFELKLLGKHNIENLLAAILIGKRLGMSLSEIKRAVSKLDYLPMTMRPYRTKTGALLIDDTFNASKHSVFAALSYMKIFKGKRILVLQPLIELGKEAKKVHYEIGKALSTFATHVFLTNSNFKKDLQAGVRQGSGRKNLIEVGTSDSIALRIERMVGRGDVVLFEGKEAGLVLRKIYHG